MVSAIVIAAVLLVIIASMFASAYFARSTSTPGAPYIPIPMNPPPPSKA
jgi:hypothetical protein